MTNKQRNPPLRMPRGIRNNNPLNIRFCSHNNWLGKVQFHQRTDESFEEFTEMKYGFRAACRLIQVYVQRHRCSTIHSIVLRFAPPSENYTDEYYKFVKDRVTTPRVDPFHWPFMRDLLCAMFQIENGRSIQSVPGAWTALEDGFKLFYNDYVYETQI